MASSPPTSKVNSPPTSKLNSKEIKQLSWDKLGSKRKKRKKKKKKKKKKTRSMGRDVRGDLDEGEAGSVDKGHRVRMHVPRIAPYRPLTQIISVQKNLVFFPVHNIQSAERFRYKIFSQ